MATLREDITAIAVGVSAIVEHNKGVDARLKDGDKRMNDHSEVIDAIKDDIGKVKGTCKERSWQEGAIKFIIVQGALTFLAIIGFLAEKLYAYMTSHSGGGTP
jgi:hypothetical protein